VIIAFEDQELDLSRVELRRSGERIRVEPQVFEVLAYLVSHRDRVVTKEELLPHIRMTPSKGPHGGAGCRQAARMQ
jgi:DNA-binding winged helix-turn-helix (wHTH) protein